MQVTLATNIMAFLINMLYTVKRRRNLN